MTDQLAKSLVAAAMELHRRRPWDRVVPEAPILLRVPGEEHPLVAVLLGEAGGEYGMMLLRGEGATGAYQRMRADSGYETVGMLGDLLAVSFDPLAAISAEYRQVLEAAGFHTRREMAAPVIFGKRPGRTMRVPGRQDMRLILACLRAVLAADDLGELEPAGLDDPERILEIRLPEERRKGEPAVSVARVPWPGPRFQVVASGLVALDPGLAELPRGAATWFLGMTPLPAREGEERVVNGLLVVDEGSGEILAERRMEGLSPEVAASAVEEACRGGRGGKEPGLPRELGFDSTSLHDALAPSLASLEVRTTLRAQPEAVKGLLLRMMDEADVAVPEQGSLQSWELAEDRLRDLFSGERIEDQLQRPAVFKRFFGSLEEGLEVLDAFNEDGEVSSAYHEWLLADHRTKRGLTSLVEEALIQEEDLDPQVRELLEGRRMARVSIFRIDRCDPASALEAVDVLSGERLLLANPGGFEDLEGRFLPLRLVRAGDLTFPHAAGPVLSGALMPAALEHLRGMGVPLTRAGLRRHTHKLARLWKWLLERENETPHLTNTDGEELVSLTGTFSVETHQELTEALAARDDVSEESERHWIWWGTGEGGTFSGRRKLLGRLDLEGDELLVRVNSHERLGRAVEWLERIPGVKLVDTEQEALDMSKILRSTGREPEDLAGDPVRSRELDRETRESLQSFLRDHYLRWLDEPVPSLDGRTPRETCATPEGRDQVAQMIRTMPSVPAPGGLVHPPRDELLRELGLGP